MNLNINKADLNSKLTNIDTDINKLNDQKINLLFESLGLNNRDDFPKDFLKWGTMLIVVQSRQISQELKQYKHP